MPVFSPHELTALGARLFTATGAGPVEAQQVAALLVEANRTGHDSHGVIRIPQYLAEIESGLLDPQALPQVEAETLVTAVVEGNRCFGQVAASHMAAVGLAKARQCGVGGVTLKGANHIGRLGSYVEDLARQGAIGLLFVNAHGGSGTMAPWGGREPRLGTNPIAIGIPRAEADPLVLDMTTSMVAEGKVRVLRNRGEQVPEGWLLDAGGLPTRDPQTLYQSPRGSIRPFGGHKGYGLGVVVDLLAGALTGDGCTGNPEVPSGNGAFLLVLDAAQFLPLEDFCLEVEELSAFVKSSELLPGYREILMPGEVEARQRAKRDIEGLFVEEETWAQIGVWAQKLGVSLE
ncbi:MAG: Ldh family oxidoreductase [Candidatus Latescibacteria bacterium]|nr:Ldh family oxidoreductase [Candidatus Latescibacterota bacterium]